VSGEPWPKEDVPDADALFMRVHRQFVVGGQLQPGAFRDQGGTMSTDWAKFSTAHQTRQRAKNPSHNSVISLVAGAIRKVPLGVEHSPDHELDNRAHTDVIGTKTSEVRLKLTTRFRWEIQA